MQAWVKCVVLLLLALGILSGFAGDSLSQESGGAYDLSKVEGIDSLKDENARALLAKNGFVVCPVFHKQIFSPYIGGWTKYVTADSVFRTYHVILEEALRELENLNAATVMQLSEKAAQGSLKMLSNAKRKETRNAALKLSAYFSLAAKLADGDYKLDERVAQMVNRELASITAGGIKNSVIFGTKFDYGRFKPGGIYSGNQLAEKYFRIMVLYGCFGFRIRSKEETLAAALLVQLFTRNPELKKLHARVEKCYQYFIGVPDDLTIAEYEKVYVETFGKDPQEKTLAENLPKFQEALGGLRSPRINDQLLSPENWVEFREKTKGLRLFGVRYIPDSELFQDLVDDKNPTPSGLYVASALGSRSAKKMLEAAKGTAFARKLDASSSEFCKRLGKSHYAKTLKCLQTLLSAAPEGAPKFMKTDAWRDREAFSALACWASARHTWVLQSKTSMYIFGVSPPKSGYVEARPEFFKGLCALAKETVVKLEELAGRRALNLKPVVRKLSEVLEIVQSFRRKDREPTPEELRKLDRFGEFWEKYFSDLSSKDEKRKFDELRKLCQHILEGKQVAQGKLKELREALSSGNYMVKMKQFVKLMDSLIVILEKQLAGKDFTEEENDLLREYGDTLGKLAFYHGNSYLHPKDDMPLIADVHANPLIERVLEVGIGRALPIYVIMTDGGKQYLCKGAIMSYYEFPQPISERLNDKQWRREVRLGKAVLPQWSSSFISRPDEKKGLEMIKQWRIPDCIDSLDRKKVVAALREALTRRDVPDKYVVREMVSKFAELAGPEELPTLLKFLEHEYYPIGVSAAKGLARLATKSQFSKLLALIKGAKPHAQDLAAYVLIKKPDISDDKALIKAMESGSSRCKVVILTLFAYRRDTGKAVKAAERLLKESKEMPVRLAAAHALASAVDLKCFDMLLAGLDDSSFSVRMACAAGLALIDDKRAIPSLKELFKTWEETDPEPAFKKEKDEFTAFHKLEGVRGYNRDYSLFCRPKYDVFSTEMLERALSALKGE